MSSSGKPKTFLGNNQTVVMGENVSTVKVIGNECVVRIGRNEGSVKVVGDGCKVVIGDGRGNLNYTGNFGKLKIGPDVELSNVNCIGNNCRILRLKEDGVEGKLKKRNSSENCFKNEEPRGRLIADALDEECAKDPKKNCPKLNGLKQNNVSEKTKTSEQGNVFNLTNATSLRIGTTHHINVCCCDLVDVPVPFVGKSELHFPVTKESKRRNH